MDGFYFLVPTLLVIFVSFLVVRAAAIALMMTGMPENKARFQALSAFSGTGFTTKEAEIVINHPVRRRIISWLMVLGNAGIVTVIITATSTLVTSTGLQLSVNALLLVVGIYIIYRIGTHRGLYDDGRAMWRINSLKHPPSKKAQQKTFCISLRAMGSCERS